MTLMSRALHSTWDLDLVTLNTLVDTLCVVGRQPQVALRVLALLLDSPRAFVGLACMGSDYVPPGVGVGGEEVAMAVARRLLLQGEARAKEEGEKDERLYHERDERVYDENQWHAQRRASICRIATSFLTACARAGEARVEGLTRAEGKTGMQPFSMVSSEDMVSSPDMVSSQDIQAVLLEVQGSGCRLDDVLVTAAVDACAVAGNVEGAYELLHKAAKEWDVRPSVTMYNAVLKAVRNAASADAPRVCNEVLMEMEEAMIKPDVVSYNTLLHVSLGHMRRFDVSGEEDQDLSERDEGYQQRERDEREEQRILLLMSSNQVLPDINTMHTRIKAAARRRNLPKVQALVAEMKKTEGMAPTDTTLALVAEACGIVGDVAGAKSILERMGAQASKETRMTAVSKEAQCKAYTAVMRAYAVKAMPLESLDVALAASRVGVDVGDAGWCALLNTWAGVGDLDMVLSVLHQMSSIGVSSLEFKTYG
jgi:hypothetical protein